MDETVEVLGCCETWWYRGRDGCKVLVVSVVRLPGKAERRMRDLQEAMRRTMKDYFGAVDNGASKGLEGHRCAGVMQAN